MRGRTGSVATVRAEDKRLSVLEVGDKPFPFALLPKKATVLLSK